jgi:type IV pilus assembly protein PilV
MRTVRARAGFTLVEVLVALFVVALGIAGVAGVQARALRSGREAARIADGAQLAAALAERMHANPVAMALADAANPYLHLDFDAATGGPPTAAPCFGEGACDSAALAQFDLGEVTSALAARFPGGRLLVCRDAAASSSWTCDGEPHAPIVIKLGWREHGEAAAQPGVLLPVAGGGA